MLPALFGILGGLLIIVADVPYILNALKGKTQPHRVTWFLVFLLNVIAFANQEASGATTSLWLFIGSIIATFSVFCVSIRTGVGGYSKSDLTILTGAILGLILWVILDSPLASIIMNMVVATIALIPTYRKAYLKPSSETKVTWLLATFAALLGVFSVGRLDYQLLFLPVFSVVAQGLMYAIIEIRD